MPKAELGWWVLVVVDINNEGRALKFDNALRSMGFKALALGRWCAQLAAASPTEAMTSAMGTVRRAASRSGVTQLQITMSASIDRPVHLVWGR